MFKTFVSAALLALSIATREIGHTTRDTTKEIGHAFKKGSSDKNDSDKKQNKNPKK